MHDFGGGIRRLFDIRNSNNNNNKNFIERFQQQQQQLEPIHSTFIPGDEPIHYIDAITKKQQSVQKRFYQKGLHKKQGRFSRALVHLLETNKSASSDDESVATTVTSNKTIDMSHIDFNQNSHQLSTLTLKEMNAKLSTAEPSPEPSEVSIQVPTIITDPIQSVSTSDHQLNPIDGNDFYNEVINRIDVMDEILDGHNNGDTDIDWYDVVDISAVRVNNHFIQEGFSKADIIHEEDFEDPEPIQFAETVDVDDKLLHVNSNDIKDNPVDKFCFYNDPRAQMDGGAKCSVTNIIEVL